MPSSPALAMAVAFLASLCACLALVDTQRWHGRLTLDSTFGVQKYHTAPTPRVGGFAILAAIATAYAVAPRSAASILGLMLISAVPAFAAGFLEDLTKKVGVLERLVATMSSGVLAWLLTGSVLQHTGVAALDTLLAYTPFAVLFTAFCVGGMANAVNIIDGFNGLAGGVVIIMLTALGLIAAQFGDTDLACICIVIGASVLGFFAVNWPSGKIFLGDGGAYLLGFLVGWVAVMLMVRNPQVSPWSPLLVCAYPVLEVAFSFYRKSRRVGSSPAQPDRVHLHMLVHRRLVKARLANWPPRLRNAMTSPFAWLYAGATAAWAALFPQDTPLLIAGFALAALGYWRVYTRLAKFRWWPPARPQLRPVFLSQHALTFSPMSHGPSMNARPFPPARPRPAPPAASHAPVSHAHVSGVARLMYTVLGASSCFAIIEPAPFELLALFLMLTYAAKKVKEPWWRLAGPLTATMLTLLGLFLVLQFVPVALQAQSPANSAFYAGVTTMLIMIAVHLGGLHGRGDVRFFDFLAGYAGAALLSAVLALISLHPGIASALDLLQWEGRPKAFFKDPNVFGPYLIPAIVIFLEAAGRRRGARTVLFILFAMICAAGVIASASRAAWANLAIVLALYLVFSSGRQKALLASAALVAAAATISFADLPLSDRVQDVFELYIGRAQLQEYDADRFAMAQEAIELGLRYPAGVGPGEVARYLGMSPGMDPHNTYVRIWAENGPVALALFSVFLLLLGAHALQECMGGRRLHPGFICAFALLAGALVNASVVDTLHWRHFWVILAVCVFSFNRRTNPDNPRRALVRA